MRKSRNRIATLIVAATTSATLLLGMSTPAQAMTTAASTMPPSPDCFKIVIPGWVNWNVDCRTRDAYGQVLRLTNKALHAKTTKERVGYMNYLIAAVAGPAVVSKKGKKVVLGSKGDQILYEAAFDGLGDANPNMIRCYRDTLLKDVVLMQNFSSGVDDFNNVVEAIENGNNARASVHREYEFIKAAGDRKEMLKFLGKTAKERAAPMLELYIKMAKDSGVYVDHASRDLLVSGTMGSLITNCAAVTATPVAHKPAPKPVAKPKYVVKTATQTFQGADLTQDLGSSNGSVNLYDRDRQGYCNPVGTQLVCKAYDSTNALDGGAEDPNDALRLNLSFDMPDDIKQRAVPGSLVTMQMTTSFIALNGGVQWEYGQYASAPKASGAVSGGGAQSQTLGVAQFNGRVLGNLDYWLLANTQVSIGSVKVTYTYTVKQ